MWTKGVPFPQNTGLAGIALPVPVLRERRSPTRAFLTPVGAEMYS